MRFKRKVEETGEAWPSDCMWWARGLPGNEVRAEAHPAAASWDCGHSTVDIVDIGWRGFTWMAGDRQPG